MHPSTICMKRFQIKYICYFRNKQLQLLLHTCLSWSKIERSLLMCFSVVFVFVVVVDYFFLLKTAIFCYETTSFCCSCLSDCFLILKVHEWCNTPSLPVELLSNQAFFSRSLDLVRNVMTSQSAIQWHHENSRQVKWAREDAWIPGCL